MLIMRCLVVLLLVLNFCAVATEAEGFLKEGQPPIKHSEATSSSVVLPNFAELAKDLSPAVVNISVEGEGEEEQAAEQLFPGLPMPLPKKDRGGPLRSLGSGFVVHEDGYIVTNSHVIEKSARIVVKLLDDKTEYPASVIGRDPKTDLALIKISPKNKLHTVYIGDSDKLEVGEWVLAIGNQFQLGQAVTAGIVSAKSRRVPIKSGSPYDAFIQTDAPINPGSSGGPLFNVKGQVIGINTAIFSPGRAGLGGSGFNIGIGFALPINLAQSVISQLKDRGKVTRGLLGVIIQRVDNDIEQILKLKSPDGALVSDVMPNSPASKAGFQRKDVIVAYEGTTIRDHEDLPILVGDTPIGSTVKIDVIRDGKELTLNAKVEELKDKPQEKEEKEKSNSIGLIVQEVTEDIAKSLNMPKASGVIVSAVSPNSVAERAGIDRGDVIEELDGQVIGNLDHFNKTVEGLEKDRPILVLVRRPEGTRFVTLKVK